MSKRRLNAPGGFSYVPKICDFGLATEIEMISDSKAARIVGTYDFFAPEIIRCQAGEMDLESSGRGGYGKKADVWALGVILFLMLTSKLPFAGSTHIEVFRKIIAGLEGVPESTIARIHSESARDLIFKMLASEPGKRLTITEVLDHPWCSNKEVSNSPRGPEYYANELDVLVKRRKLRTVCFRLPILALLHRNSQAPFRQHLIASRSLAVFSQFMTRDGAEDEVEDVDEVMYAARAIFEAYDTDGDGFLSMEEMRWVFFHV